MKTILKHIIVVFWAVFFLTAGLGFNIEKYCCDSCANEGPQKIAFQLYKIEKLLIATDFSLKQQEEPCCSFKRFQVDIPVLYNNIQTTYFQKTIPQSFSLLTSVLLDTYNFKQVPLHPPPNHLFLKSGRAILAFKSVLLI